MKQTIGVTNMGTYKLTSNMTKAKVFPTENQAKVAMIAGVKAKVVPLPASMYSTPSLVGYVIQVREGHYAEAIELCL